MGLELFFTFLLVLLNGFFVAAEFALVKVRASQIDIKIQKGSTRAKTAKTLVEKLDAYLSATQLGITLASLALGWVGEDVISHVVQLVFLKIGFAPDSFAIHSISIPIAFSIITFLMFQLLVS